MPSPKEYWLQLQDRTGTAEALVEECARIRAGLAPLGLIPLGYDPGVTVRDKDSCATTEIPLWLLKRLLAITEARNA